MNLPLETLEVWRTAEVIQVKDFFQAIGRILQKEDLLIVGSYDGFRGRASEVKRLAVQGGGYPQAYSDSFELNRTDHP